MSAVPSKTSKLEQLNKKQVHAMDEREPKTASGIERFRRKIRSGQDERMFSWLRRLTIVASNTSAVL
jgi:hypothetical protein